MATSLSSFAAELRRIADNLDRLAPAGPKTPAAAVPSLIVLDEAAERLFQNLRVWRTDRARRDRVPPYVVATDRQLMAVAQARPADTAALRSAGFGPSRTERLGTEVLEVVGKA